MKAETTSIFLFILLFIGAGNLVEREAWAETNERTHEETANLVAHGRYLATIGVCEACHTPPAVMPEADQVEDLKLRSNPNWFQYLDNDRKMAGGVPFILRFGSTSSGFVSTSNITPDPETGIGNWSEEEIMSVLREGKRPGGGALFRFAPHTFYSSMAEEDARAIAVYLKTLPPVKNLVSPRSLPFPVAPAESVTSLKAAPKGQNLERAEYLMEAIVGCKECHSYRGSDGQLVPFVGGDSSDPFIGVFRMGPDLPLREKEKGFAAFPYPGYAVLYGGNLTRFGLGGDWAHVSSERIAESMRTGVSAVHSDDDGRPKLLAHVMMWQFYRHMAQEDAMAIAQYLKTLRYEKHEVPRQLQLFGDDWEGAFEAVFGEPPSENDKQIFGKTE